MGFLKYAPFVLLLLIGMLARSFGCATLTLEDELNGGLVTAEKAVIIWDDAHKMEHFIRQADFRTTDADLGFIVPTPNLPELSEADPSIFKMASDVSTPYRVPRRAYYSLLDDIVDVFGGPMRFGKSITDTFGITNANMIDVISQQDVGAYHATVLKADNAGDLAKWLQQNGYHWNKEDEIWLKPYIEKHWIITAFKLISKTPSDYVLVSQAIRLSFHADQPFFPYSEPGGENVTAFSTREFSNRVLLVTVLSDQRMKGELENGKPWPGELRYAGSSVPDPRIAPNWNAQQWLSLAHLSSSTPFPKSISAFQDRSSPRPGSADLIFSPDPDQSEFRMAEVDQSLPKLILVEPVGEVLGALILVFISSCCVLSGLWFRAIGNSVPVSKPNLGTMLVGGCAMLSGLVCIITYGACVLVVPVILMVASREGSGTVAFLYLLVFFAVSLLLSFSVFYYGVISTGFYKQAQFLPMLRRPRFFGTLGIIGGCLFFVGVLVHHFTSDHSLWTAM